MKKTIFAFVLGLGSAIGITVYGARLISTNSGEIVVPAQPAIVAQISTSQAPEVVPQAQYVAPAGKVYSQAISPEEARLRAIEARLTALEAKQK